MRIARWKKIFGALFLAAAILGVLFVWNIGSVLVAPANRPIGNPPPNLHAQSVEFPSASGATIHGWLVAGQPGRGTVILMHGVHANRLSLVARAEFLSRAGYAVLLFDFQGHGESIAKTITFGFLESRDATAAAGQRAGFGIFVSDDLSGHRRPDGHPVWIIGQTRHAAADLPVDASARYWIE
jgi:hypothetical protein